MNTEWQKYREIALKVLYANCVELPYGMHVEVAEAMADALVEPCQVCGSPGGFCCQEETGIYE